MTSSYDCILPYNAGAVPGNQCISGVGISIVYINQMWSGSTVQQSCRGIRAYLHGMFEAL